MSKTQQKHCKRSFGRNVLLLGKLAMTFSPPTHHLEKGRQTKSRYRTSSKQKNSVILNYVTAWPMLLIGQKTQAGVLDLDSGWGSRSHNSTQVGVLDLMSSAMGRGVGGGPPRTRNQVKPHQENKSNHGIVEIGFGCLCTFKKHHYVANPV